MSFIGIATAAAKRGLAVYPTLPGERGPCKGSPPGWTTGATTDAEQIAEWAAKWPDYNVICVANPATSIVLDIDDPELAAKRGFPFGECENTLWVRTPGGGLHIHFSAGRYAIQIDRNRNIKLDGDLAVEYKYRAASVAAPGTVRADGGRYLIERDNQKEPIPLSVMTWLLEHSEPVRTGKTRGIPVHEDFDFDLLTDFFDVDIVDVSGIWYTPRYCPIKGDWHTNSGKPDFGAAGFAWDEDNRTLGWKDHAQSCDGANMNVKQVIEFLEEQKGEEYPYPLFADPRLHELSESDWVDMGDTEDTLGSPAAPAKKEKKIKTVDEIKTQIDEIMMLPSKPTKSSPEFMPERQKYRAVSTLIFEHMKATGRFYNCGNVMTWVDGEKREVIQVIEGSPAFQRKLIDYGVYPADKVSKAVGPFLGACATDFSTNTVYTIGNYDRAKHVLYVNEYDGKFLRIDCDGRVERCANGDHNMLFADGKAGQCVPLCADVDKVNAELESFEFAATAKGLQPGGVLQSEVLDTINYSEEGVGRENAQIILMTAILALFFHERIPSNPFIYLYGPGASMKSSIAQKIGKLLQGPYFRVTPATDEVDELKILAMNKPFLVLDEANNVKKLTNALKSIATGSMDSRRELYTTANMRETPYQARIWMTANTASLTNETISSRLMIIDAGARTEQNPYRSEFYLEWPREKRNEIWTELVQRLALVMWKLTYADQTGEGDLNVSHRMSSFFVFGQTVARQEGWEDKFLAAMRAMALRQEGASAEGNEIVDVILSLPASYNGELKSATEWAKLLPHVVPEDNVELRRNCARPGWVRYQFTSNVTVLGSRCGMKTKQKINAQKNKTNVYSFAYCAGKEQLLTDEDESSTAAVRSSEVDEVM